MRLKEFCEGVLSQMQPESIIIAEYDEGYLKELCTQYDILGKIRFVLDDSAQRQGVKSFFYRSVTVVPYAELKNISGSRAIIIVASDYPIEAQEKIEKADASAVDRSFVFLNRESQMELFYRKKYDAYALQNRILFWSGPYENGHAVSEMEFSDNARALFDYMIANGFNSKWELVWLVNEPGKYETRYGKVKNVSFLSILDKDSKDEKKRDAYYKKLFLAKYIFTTDGYGFAKNVRKDQIRVQLWHGCGIKNRIHFTRCEHRYEYMTVLSDLYADLHKNSYGLRDDQIIVSGYPRVDCLFSPRCDWIQKLNIPAAGRYVFWLPTFRNTCVDGLWHLSQDLNGIPVLKTEEDFERVDSFLGSHGMVLVIKLHPLQNKKDIAVPRMKHIVLVDNGEMKRQDIRIEEILGDGAALISDYSSVAIDYTILDRPMAFTVDDCEAYGRSRVFNWSNVHDWLPGKEIASSEDFIEFLEEAAKGEDPLREKRQRLRRRFHKYFDDKSSHRILDFFGIKNS